MPFQNGYWGDLDGNLQFRFSSNRRFSQMVILIPLAFSLGLDATEALVLMTAVYYGSMGSSYINYDDHLRYFIDISILFLQL